MLTVRTYVSGKLLLSFTLDGQTKLLQRSSDETIRRTLRRIEMSLLSKRDQKLMKKKPTPGPDFVVTVGTVAESRRQEDDADELSPDTQLLDAHGCPVPHDTANHAAWHHGGVVKFGGRSLEIERDPPTISSLSIVARPLVGIPIYPVITSESVDLSLSKFEWFRRSSPDAPVGIAKEDSSSKAKQKLAEPVEIDAPLWEPCGVGCVYKPTVEDVGRRLALRCTPSSNRMEWMGPHAVAVTSTPVEYIPDSLPFQRRQQKYLGDSFSQDGKNLRVITYNILADALATTEYAMSTLFPYCAYRFLDPDYRKQMIATELVGYRGDMVCLQEVGPKEFDYLTHVLGNNGYAGLYAMKKGSNTDGCALFYRRGRLEVVGNPKSFELASCVEDARYEPLMELFYGSNHSLRRITKSRTTVVQFVALRDLSRAEDANNVVIVANTHLYFHPEADAIRAVQLAIVACEAARFRSDAFGAESMSRVGLLLTGDLNSRTASMATRLLRHGRTQVDWVADLLRLRARFTSAFQSIVTSNDSTHALTFPSPSNGGNTVATKEAEDGDARLSDTALQAEAAELAGRVAALEDIGRMVGVPLPLRFDLASGTPAFTNFVPTFAEALDHVLVDAGGPLESCDNAVPIPPIEEITAETALPSSVFPSDHLAVICEVRWMQ